ncbi:MAG: transcription termination/antitermination protein NusA [Clostridiales bacterium]|nr:transcription termination/antitermination protein NusA [Clostridiales bacterium]
MAAVDDLERTRGVDREMLLQAVEQALVSAYRRHRPGAGGDVVARIDRETGEPRLFLRKEVVQEVKDPDREIGWDEARRIQPSVQVGDVVEIPVEVANLGRIAAQTAKQVVMQKLREAERHMVYEEYAQREGDIVTGLVSRIVGKNAFIDLGKTEAILPPSEQVQGETLRQGQRVKVYLVEVKMTNRGPQILASRSHPGLLKRLFELEVPEIQQGLVEIKAVAREAGSRSKVAVWARDPHIDPVGACVGPKHMRISHIVDELGGEKIDVIEWSPDPEVFVANALRPAKVGSVTLDPTTKTAHIVVPDYQLSLAIGKAGQNARLAAKLTGWRVDIRSESQVQGEEAGGL